MDVMGGFLEDMLCLLLCILPAYHIEQKADGMTPQLESWICHDL